MPLARIWGHRGSPRLAPENTLPSFARAARDGAQGIEFDVRCSADGIPVVMHDATVDRTTDGAGPVARLTLAQLRTLRVGAREFPGARAVRVPTLDETLGLAAEFGLEIVLEIKDGRPGAIDACVAEVERHALLPRVYFHSFDIADLWQVRRRSPRARLQLIGDAATDLFAPARAVGAQAFSPYDAHLRAEQIPPAHVARAAAHSMELNAGLVNSPELHVALSAAGVAAVFTDVPHVLSGARDQTR